MSVIKFGIRSAAILMLSLIGLVQTSNLAYASSTITVNSTADTTIDDGVCTFREAIIASNTDTASGASPGRMYRRKR